MANFLRKMFRQEPGPYQHGPALELLDQRQERLAALALPPSPPPKAPKGGGAAYPGFRKSTTASPSQIPRERVDIANVDLVPTFRTGADTFDIARKLSRISPELAGSQAAHLRVGIPENFILVARDPDGEFNVEATRLAMQIARKMNTMPDYENGFSHVGSLRSVSEALGRQMVQTGAMATELVLDKSRLPFKLQPVPTTQVFFFDDDKGVRPVQRVGGVDIDLDIPTFFYVALDPDLLDVYAQSPLESALQPVLGATQFLTDLRRLCARHIYKRFDIAIDQEKLTARMPLEIQGDAQAVSDWLNAQLGELETLINNLGVEEALIHYDFFEVKYVEGDNGDTPNTFDTVNNIMSGKIATATKTPLAVLGLGGKSASMANTETLMFMLTANGMIRVKLQELYSKAFTLAVRLMGADVTVEFIFDEIELRPKSELWAYRLMEKEHWRQQLSDGYITDEEYALRTTGNLPRKGFVARVGTYFADGKTGDTSANPDSQTSNMGRDRNKAPENPKGPAK